MNNIRDDIEATVIRRADVYRRQAHGATPELADIRAGLDAEIRLLWEEYRAARVDVSNVLLDLSPAYVRLLVRSNPRLVLA